MVAEVCPPESVSLTESELREAVQRMLDGLRLPATFEAPRSQKLTNVLRLGNYDSPAQNGLTAAEAYAMVVNAGKAPLNEFCEWIGMKEEFIAMAAGREGLHILEIGGGDGRQMEAAVSSLNPAHMAFIEKSRRMLGMAKDRLPDREVNWIEASAEEGLRQLNEGAFDLGFASLVLHYLEPWQLATFFIRLNDVLKEGGQFAFTTGSPSLIGALTGGKDGRRITWSMHGVEEGTSVFEMEANVFAREEYIALAEMAGFRVTRRSLHHQIPDDAPVGNMEKPEIWDMYVLTKPRREIEP